MNILTKAKNNRWLIAAFFICSVAALVPIWSVKYLPMVDLPQHAAQISIIRNYNNPAFDFKDQFELHWFTPYVLPTLLTVLPSYLVGVFSSLKITISLYILLLPLSMCFLFKETKGDTWWGLCGFALCYGHCFYWGFLVYLMAIPVGIFYLILGIRYKKEATFNQAIGLFVTGLCLFFCHAIVYAITNLILVAILFKPDKPRFLLQRFRPLLYQLPLPIVWMAINKLSKFDFNFPTEWHFNTAMRLGEGLFYLLGTQGDEWALLGMIVMVVSLFVGSRIPEQNFRLWVLVPLLCYVILPYQVFGIYYLYPRMAFFVLVVGLMCLEPTTSFPRRAVSRSAVLLFTVGWMVLLTLRFRVFNVDAADFDTASKNIPANSRILDLSFHKGGFFSGEDFSHFSAWIQADRGGVLGYSFGYHYNIVAQYRHRKEPLSFWAGTQIHWNPMKAIIYDTRSFDYIVLRSLADPIENLDLIMPSPKRLISHVGMWWVYKRIK